VTLADGSKFSASIFWWRQAGGRFYRSMKNADLGITSNDIAADPPKTT
jgi:hypothetical protein